MGVFVSVNCVGTPQFALGFDLGAMCSWTDENNLYLPFWHGIEYFLCFVCLPLFPRPTDSRTFFCPSPTFFVCHSPIFSGILNMETTRLAPFAH